MWKNWKEKIIDFFYEETDEEEFEKVERSETFRPVVRQERHVDTKVAYQYPKQQPAPFRFPVIPDQTAPVKQERPISNTQRRRSIERKLKAKTKSHQSRYEKDLLMHGYQRKKVQKELEDVPAYIRRRMEAEHKEQKVQEEEEHPQQKEKEIPATVTYDFSGVKHTKPEELDEVFRKRDGRPLPETDQVERKTADEVADNENRHVHLASEPELNMSNPEIIAPVPKTEEPEEMGAGGSHVSYEAKTPVEPVPETAPIRESSPTERSERSVESIATIQEAEEREPVPNYLLNDPAEPGEDDSDWLIEQQILLEDTLTHFHIDATVVNVTQGPSVTRFEIQPALGVKVSKIRNLADDMKLNLAAKDIRIEAPIPGKNTIGIEVPNQYPQMVTLQKIIETDAFRTSASPLSIALGLTIEGEPLVTNIDKMPHGLIAGATGSGKSVCINTILLSLLYKADYRDVRFLLIDPKMVELTPYNGIPHLIAPVITDIKAATAALKWAVDEMEVRYQKFVEAGVRNIQKYNEKMEKSGNQQEKMSYIVIVIDELADLMMVSPQEVEDAICRIAQKARACGMHLLLATQRPSVDVITGLIKANIPTRIAFAVSSQVDSRTMLDANGAEKLLGKGDMLFVENGANKSVRLQGPFVSDEEIDRVVSYMKTLAEPDYLFEQEQLIIEVDQEKEDDLLEEVIQFVFGQKQASTSLLQRRFRIGYNRAARLIDTLEQKGIISGQNGSKPREVLLTQSQYEDLFV